MDKMTAPKHIDETYPEHIPDGQWIDGDGYEVWVKDGKWHRTDGPAVIRTDGLMQWRVDGFLHRDDGPAVVNPDGDIDWYFRGEWYNFEEWLDINSEITDSQKVFLKLKYG